MTAEQRHRILIAATPTPNGDLHVGHMAGPYLAADVYARYLRAAGLPVTYTTATDDSQTYVTSTARRQGTTPARLAAESTLAIEGSLTALGIELSAPEGRVLPPIDARYREAVTEFVRALHEAGRLRTLTVRLPYAERAGQYLYDGLLSGSCPSCGAASSGGGCEDCGHPNNFDELREARYALDAEDPVSYREETILALPMEEYRAELEAHFAEVLPRWRPRPARLVRELLDRPLPVIPVTVPGDWGVPAPFAPTPGQVVYPWVEAMPASMYATWWANGADRSLPYDEYWKASHGAEPVYFHGFDNVYHWGLVDLVLLLAHGDRYVRPSASVVNEFYELDHAKFSTSRNHLIRGAELVAETPRDTARFYLALTLPERERTNFDRAALAEVTARRLTGPWNELAARLAERTEPVGAEPQQITAAGRADEERFAAALRDCFELTGFSVARAAALLADRIAELNERAAGPGELGDLLAAVRSLLAWSAPILVDTARRAAEAGVVLALDAGPADKIAPFRVPPLP
ncbi:class I tRNA ligase family protein [Kitasatospora viridis]|uniref:Methionyl-tRNA synthetase n=1 Tax=Kitasatospora viridis TaxID=281105 RepID=A0A561UCA2_9ACTN|nr:class I tRNA ligase family protein [Kitasatospora viridis]TWF96995.1 methionyl-tRNA synthetase [Kitasatospora viridis]